MQVLRITVLATILVGCSNTPDPRLIQGGGIGDGEIDGTLHVYVIDHDTKAAVSGATVAVGSKQATTDSKGLVTFSDLSGEQTVTVKATGYRGTVWAYVNGANVTIPVTASMQTVEQATLRGTITGYDTFTVPAMHVKAAFVGYSQDDNLGDAENNIQTPANGNICVGPTCNWTLASRSGTVTVTAAILDIDPKGTADPSDDVRTVIGYAYKPGIVVANGVDQTGIVLDLIEAGNLQTVTIDVGSPPAALTQVVPIVGIEVSSDEVVQLGLPTPGVTSMLVPNPSVFAGSATYRLSVIAQTQQTTTGAQSVVLRQGLTGTALAAGTWLEPPTGVTVTRTNATCDRVTGAKAHTASWTDATGTTLVEITSFDAAKTSLDVPSLIALPTSGALTAKMQAIGADFDIHNFSLDLDKKKLWGISAEPATVP